MRRSYRLSPKHLLTIIVIALCGDVNAAQGREQSCTLSGFIRDAESGKPVSGASIRIEGLQAGVAADTLGAFALVGIADGSYQLKISHIGYETQTRDVVLDCALGALVTINLVPQAVMLGGIVVTSSQTVGPNEPAGARQTVTQHTLSNAPELGDDSFRAAARLPGLTSGDFTARFTVRGGEFEEVLVMLDGMRLYEPFHLKDLDGGAMSILAGDAITGIDLLTGGFPAAYGDKMSGVFNIRSRPVNPCQRRVRAGISLLAAEALAEGTFHGARGSWLVLARRGYLEHVAKLARETEEISPRYHDLYSKLRYEVSRTIAFSFQTLYAGDHVDFRGDDVNPGDTLSSRYTNFYAWAAVSFTPSRTLSWRSLLFGGRVARNRTGSVGAKSVDNTLYAASDRRDLEMLGSKTDVDLVVRDWLGINMGIESQWSRSDYDYVSRDYYYAYYFTPDGIEQRLAGIDSSEVVLAKNGARIGAYLTNRLRLASRADLEIGLRWDHTSHAGDNLLSPRISLAFPTLGKTTVRAAWGTYFQTQEMDQIAVGYGETEFYSAQKAEHLVLSLERRFANGVFVKAEGYRKWYSRLRPAYRDFTNGLLLLPERESYAVVFRTARESRGVELTTSRDVGGLFSWWLSYGYASVYDRVDHVTTNFAILPVCRREIPGPQDQRHTLHVDVHMRPTARWLLSAAFQAHTGWPYTEAHLQPGSADVELDSLWNDRFQSFERFDLRVSRLFPLGKGRITAYAELLNVLGRENIRFYTWEVDFVGGGAVLIKEPQHWLGRIPSFGISYELEY